MGRFLITGASGLIGRHMIDCLLEKSTDHIVGLCNRTKPQLDHERITWIQVDLTKEPVTGIKPEEITTVIHCAALSPTSVYSDELCADTNRNIDKHVLDFCEANPAITIAYLSSIYLERYTEEQLEQNSQYLYQKRQSEHRLAAMKNKWAAFRISSPYGIHQTYRNVFKRFMEKAMAGEDLLLHGTGSRTQDFIAADDVTAAILLFLYTNVIGIFNVCSSQPVSMLDLAETVKQNSPNPIKIVFSGEPDSQENYRVNFDNSETFIRLGWKPAVSLQQGVQNWFSFLQQ